MKSKANATVCKCSKYSRKNFWRRTYYEKETIVNLGNVYSFGFGFTYRLFRKQFSVL